MNKKEIAEAQALIDSVMNGTGPLEPCKAVFPADLGAEERAREWRQVNWYDKVPEQLDKALAVYGSIEHDRGRREGLDLLHEIDKWCSGENQVNDGEDAEDALRYIQEAIRAFIAGSQRISAKPGGEEGT